MVAAGGGICFAGYMVPDEGEKILYSLLGAGVIALGGSYFRHLHNESKLKEAPIITLDKKVFWHETKGQYTWDDIKKAKKQTSVWTDQNGYTHRRVFLEIHTKNGIFDIYPDEIRISVYELRNFIKEYKKKYSTKMTKKK